MSTEEFGDEVRARMSSVGSKAADEPVRFPRRARPERLQLAQHVRQLHCYVAPAGTTIADVMSQGFWQPIHQKLRAWDRIEILEEGGVFFVELLVVSVDASGAVLAGLRGVELHGQVGVRDAAPRNVTGATVQYRGPHRKWTVELNGQTLAEQLATESAAQLWLASHERAQARDRA